jgi:hypothetical protein
VRDKFQKTAKGSRAFREQAQEYLAKTIPDAIQEMTKTPGAGKMIVPAIVCAGGKAGAVPAKGQSVSCMQMDADVSLQWIGAPSGEFPISANQAGKLPYTLRLIVLVDPSGKVKVEKDGNMDNEFFKKARDAPKNWKTPFPGPAARQSKSAFL